MSEEVKIDRPGLFGKNSLCLAPLAGYSDAPFRLLCFEFGADFAVTEMVSSEGLIRAGDKTRKILRRMEGEGPVGCQLFGARPESMARAAELAAGTGPAFIDLNFGCPVKKVVKKNGGSALMRDLPLMEKIIHAVKSRVTLPVTAKIRSGWSAAEENYLEAGEILEGAGVSAITLHPRYRTQGFGGSAHWDHIARLKERVSIPVIASGDVKSVADYLKIVDTTACDVVMIGRGAFGRPWIFREIKDRLSGRDTDPVEGVERINILERQVRMEVEWKGEKRGVMELRKIYRWYLKGLPGMKDFRTRLSRSGTLREVLEILEDLREEIRKQWKETA
ncbi:MAG: tRNA dihydrouridine synthase DusB [Candidatus Krumholzibacteriota bacterium]|nr:tRNA dihydrouridine synthase DusB [Candidatus Krumholzibacteriota bacterium]